MKKQIWTRIISGALAVSMMITMFAGCDSKTTEEEEDQVSATSVVYNNDGKYTTTLTSDKIELKGITADKVSVIYETFDSEGYESALNAANEDETVDSEKFYAEANATVNSVKANDDGSLTVDFTDENADKNATSNYIVQIDKPKSNASVDVDSVEYEIITNVESVSAYDESIRLTLMLDNGEYADDISEEDIELYGGFKPLKIASLSSSGKNLTVQLIGKMEKDTYSNAYLDGFVGIDRSGIKNAMNNTSVSVPVVSQAAMFDPSSLYTNENTTSLVLNVYRNGLMDGITAKDITFEKGVTVTNIAKIDETKYALIMNVEGATDANAAATVLNGQTMTLNGSSFPVHLGKASFYPVFDYVEEDGENLKFTLMLYASNGKFTDELAASEIALSEGFEGGEVVSLEKTDDTVAELIISVPAQGQTTETLDMNGTVTLAGGTLLNVWGTALSESVNSERNYAQDSMGRVLGGEDIDIIKNIVGGFGNTTFGTVSSVCSGAISAGSGIYTILQVAGVLPSPLSELKKVMTYLDDMQNTLNHVEAMLEEMKRDDLKKQITSFYRDLNELGDACVSVENKFKNAVETVLESEGKKFNTGEEMEKYFKNLSDKEAEALFEKVVAEFVTNMGGENRIQELENRLSTVKAHLKSYMHNDSIFAIYDEYTTLVYNFDTGTYSDRTLFRTVIEKVTSDTILMLHSYYKYHPSKSMRGSVEGVKNTLDELKTYFNNNAIKYRTDGKIYCYPFGLTFRREMAPSTRFTDKNGDACAFPAGKLTYYSDTVNNCTPLAYQPQITDKKVVVDGKVVVDRTNSNFKEQSGPFTGGTIVVTHGDDSTVEYKYKGHLDCCSKAGKDVTDKKQIDEFVRRTKYFYESKGYGLDPDNSTIDVYMYYAKQYVDAGFVPLLFVSGSNLRGVAYDMWKKKMGNLFKGYYQQYRGKVFRGYFNWDNEFFGRTGKNSTECALHLILAD